jgi:hypothetical protein
MLVCFGASWPISITKALRTRQVAGKSPLFLAIIIAGYASGIVHKLLYSRNWVVLLYLLNLIMVSVDLALYMRLSKSALGRESLLPAGSEGVHEGLAAPGTTDVQARRACM